MNTTRTPASAARAFLVILTAALPVTLCGATNEPKARAIYHAPIVAHERTSVVDTFRSANVWVEASDSLADAHLGIDGREDTAWTGQAGASHWTWTARFAVRAHIALLRAHVGTSTTEGVPVAYRWEALAPRGPGEECGPNDPAEESWTPIEGAEQSGAPMGSAQPTRRSWFVDVDACGLRLTVDATNGGPPVLREMQAIEGARNVLRDAQAVADATLTGFSAAGAIDGTYAGRWVGGPGHTKWALRVDLRRPELVDRVRLILGLDATSVPRPATGRSYAIAWAPLRYALETSDDGDRFEPIASEPRRADGSILPLRRRLITLEAPRLVRAIRLTIDGATGSDGRPDPSAVPVVREIAAYRRGDPSPILAEPWLLNINANPSGQTHASSGGELADDVRHAKFLQASFAPLLSALRRDDPEARWRTRSVETIDAPSNDRAGEALESIEGDDPLLDAWLLAQSTPPPIAVLSGSNDWDYASDAGPDAAAPKRWHWDPLRNSGRGGMAGLGVAVRQRVAPFLGFCGGAQILSLLEADAPDQDRSMTDEELIDEVLRRTTGAPIRGFAPPPAVERAWPGDPRSSRTAVAFAAEDPLFTDVAGPLGRSSTQALPLCHSDAIRSDAFLPGAALDRFEVLATSTFCGADVLAVGPGDPVFSNPSGPGSCRLIPQAFRSRDRAWPIIGAQFHPEQRDFARAAPGDPPESVADPRLFLDSAFELIVDAHVKLAP